MGHLILAENRTANVYIRIPENPAAAIATAARELVHYLRLITGAVFPIRNAGGENAICLDPDPNLGEEAFRIQTTEAGLSIRGGSPRGVLYGVYSFLEDNLGVRFYTHDVTKIPKQSRLVLGALDISDAPFFEYRRIDHPLCSMAEWGARNRVNSLRCPPAQMAPFGGGKEYALFVHTFNRLVDPEIYFDEHPEYFSLRDGKRTKKLSQLCLTNPDVIALAAENAKKHLRANPDAALISVSQNDWANPCECPNCLRKNEETGGLSGTLVYFVNAVAEEIEKEFPHVLVDTLAYQYTRTPPTNIRPRHNVCVRLCSFECCFGHPLETCHHNCSFSITNSAPASTFQSDLIGWGKICDRVYIWDYVTDFAHFWLPFPNFHVLGPNMRFFAKNSVKGMYPEGNYLSASPDLAEMRSWLLAKLMWNPDFDVEAGIYEFTETVYGAAAPEIRAYLKLLETRVTEGNIHFGIGAEPDAEYLDPETLSQAQALMAQAKKKELTLSQRIYVEKAALSVEYAAVWQEIKKGNLDLPRAEAMFSMGRTLGITSIQEWAPWYGAMCQIYDVAPREE